VGTTFRSSTKIEALLHDLWKAQFEEPGCKAIVFRCVPTFMSSPCYSSHSSGTTNAIVVLVIVVLIVMQWCSQFVNMLDLIQHRLAQAGVRCVKMDGSMSVAARDRVINAFREDPHVTVFLISLKAGGVALNLTAASRIYLMDPWWNPAAEVRTNACVTTTGSYCLVPFMYLLLASIISIVHTIKRVCSFKPWIVHTDWGSTAPSQWCDSSCATPWKRRFWRCRRRNGLCLKERSVKIPPH
jgi:hypothetical protein